MHPPTPEAMAGQAVRIENEGGIDVCINSDFALTFHICSPN
jgi:hypothetical protein